MKNMKFILEDIYDRLAGNEGSAYTPLTPSDLEDITIDLTDRKIYFTTTAEYNKGEAGRGYVITIEKWNKGDE